MEEFEHTLSRLKKAVTEKSELSPLILIDLVNRFSNDEQLQTEAILLNSEFNALTSDDHAAKLILFDDMMHVAGQVSNQSPAVLNEQDIKAIQDDWLENRKPKEIVFSCRNLYKMYKRSGFELQDINLDLKEGEITGVIGENGNGKTTLLKIIAGELSPNKGSISYGKLQSGNHLSWDLVRPRIAYLSQELGRLFGPVRQSIQYAASLHGITGSQNDKETDYIIQRLGLNKYKNASWEQLSGGYKLRFALAKTLVWKPKLLVLDEPLANLDINTQIRVLSDLRDLSKSLKDPMAVILSSQNIEEVESASDNMIVLANGRIKFNDQTIHVGRGRAYNLFEFKTDILPEIVEQKLAGLTYYGLDFNGFSWFIQTTLDVSLMDFATWCMNNKMEITFLQDVGISAKSLIVQTNLQDIHV